MADELDLSNAPDGEEQLAEGVDIELTDDDMGGQSLADFVTDIGDDTQPAGEGGDTAPAGEGDDTQPAAEGEDATAEPPRQRQPRAQVRIQALTAERDAAAARAAELEAAHNLAVQRAAEAEYAAIFHHQAALKTQAEGIKSRLAQAKRDGDTDAEIDLQTQLNVITIDLNAASEALQSAPPRAAPPVEQPRPQPAPAPVQQQQHVQLQPETAAWIQRNQWFQQGSPHFGPEMSEEAQSYARSIERRYMREGRQNEIGNQAYFMEIDRRMRTEFPDAFDDPAPAPRAVPPMSRDNSVAPVQRGGAPAPGAPQSGRTVRLDATERSLAHTLAANGALKKPDGSRPTPAEAERMYAAQKLKTSPGR